MFLHLLEVEELGGLLDLEGELLLELCPEVIALILVPSLHVSHHLLSLLRELAQLLIPKPIEISELVLVGAVEVVVLLVVALLHLVNAAGLEIPLELLGGEPVVLSLDVVTILLVFVHLREGLVQGGLDLVSRTVYPDLTHAFILLKLNDNKIYQQ